MFGLNNNSNDNQYADLSKRNGESQDTSYTRPEVREEDFINTSDPNGNPSGDVPMTSKENPLQKPSTISRIVEYTTGMPIDGVYIYMERDWEAEGKADAMNNPDVTNMTTKIEMIKQGLARRFDLTRLKYNKIIREYESQIERLNIFGLTGSISSLTAQIDTCKEHIGKIDELERRFRQEAPEMTSMTDSYKRGFVNGVAQKTQESINDNN